MWWSRNRRRWTPSTTPAEQVARILHAEVQLQQATERLQKAEERQPEIDEQSILSHTLSRENGLARLFEEALLARRRGEA